MTYHRSPKTVKKVISALAFTLLVLRRRSPYMFCGVYWRFCSHRSHHRHLRCWRAFVHDGYCARHIASCDRGCDA